MAQRRGKFQKEFTARDNLNRMVYYEVGGDVLAAISREKQIKTWGRMKKIVLIESMNRDWKELSAGWLGSAASTTGRNKGTERDSSSAAASSE